MVSIGLKPSKQVAHELNERSSNIIANVNKQFNKIPDEMYDLRLVVHDREYIINLKPLLEIDVTQLSELTIANIRVQIERVASVRLTLEKAYEQMMEEYALWQINYEVWWAGTKGKGREWYWNEIKTFAELHNLAKSSLKPPTEDDILSTILTRVGSEVEYRLRMEQKIDFQRTKSFFEKVDEILNKREFSLKTILDSRVSKV
jgi:hypothetical protein